MLAFERIRRMTLAEMTYRGRQGAAKWIDRVAPHRALPLAPQRPSARVRNLGVDGQAVRQAGARWPAHTTRLLAAADRIREHRFALLGYEDVWFGDPVDWHLDPIAGKRAPRVHWSRIDALDPEQVGDSKVIWELSRHQWLVTLGQAYRITSDERYAQAAAHLLDAWLRANPRGIGINWTSSLELAYRLIAWCWAIALFDRSAAMHQAPFVDLAASLRDHAQHVERYLSIYFSPNTHLTGEALGLFYAGVLAGADRDAVRWRDLGRRILIDQSAHQILRDGVHFEQAACYHRYTIEIYLHFLTVAAKYGVDVPPAVVARVAKMLDVLAHLCRADGMMPQIGDADSGWALPLAVRSSQDCRGVFAVAAVLFGREDFARLAGGDAPEVAWLLGTNGLKDLARLESAGIPDQPSPASKIFPSGGYAVMRSGWGPEALQLIVDVGPLGCPISAAHGHADLLNLECAAFGESWIADRGTGGYTTDPAWRRYFRTTAAHSTVTVDGLSQAEPTGPFSWRSRPSARLRAWSSDSKVDFVDADHDAYCRLADPVLHRRRVVFVKPRYWVVVDDLLGAAVHDIELRFQLTARPTLRPDHAAFAGRNGSGLWVMPHSATPLVALVREGSDMPLDGWQSRAYGQREPAPVLIYRVRARLPVRVATVLYPVAGEAAEPPRVEPFGADRGLVDGLVMRDHGELIRFVDAVFVVEPAEARRDDAPRR
jgi:uncharacterized heparinase superfamily protein